ncbi:dephospho-CoA kinase [soil metagenome]
MSGNWTGPFIIGVTGNIACGKSTVMAELGSLGAWLVDADAVYHTLIEPGEPLYDVIVGQFGHEILAAAGTIDRRLLGDLVFRDRDLLTELERITHPLIRLTILETIATSPSNVVAIDAVKLIEGGLAALCNSVWLVVCDPQQQIERLTQRNRISAEEAEMRIAAQPDTDSRRDQVDVVIDNNGSINSTISQVRTSWAMLGL